MKRLSFPDHLAHDIHSELAKLPEVENEKNPEERGEKILQALKQHRKETIK